MKKLVFLLLLLVPLLVFGVYGYGKNLPEAYEVTRRALYDQSTTALWQAVTDYEKFPGWTESITRVERREDQEGLPVWRFYNQDGHYMDVAVIKEEAPELLAVRVVETDLPYGGSWTLIFTRKDDDTTELTVKEEGVIDHPFWRLAMKFVFAPEAMADQFLASLGRKFGEKVEIR